MVALSVADVVLLILGLSFYLYVLGTLLTRVAVNLEECADLVRTISRNAEAIMPGVEHINRTGGVVAGALPLLYGMAEGIVKGVTPRAPLPEVPEVARPASGPPPLPPAARGRLQPAGLGPARTGPARASQRPKARA